MPNTTEPRADSGPLPPETILVVDDEDSIRKTFREWLESAHLRVRILTAPDAESALLIANEETVDLAILDWNLGAGHDGLRLLEDLYLFNPDVVAIMITGYAHQATPLDAMRMGVRDYLDKNQDLNRAAFLRSVQRQLERIRPARQQRRLMQQLSLFRETVQKILPLVESANALRDPLSLPEAITSLLRLLLHSTRARDGILLVHHHEAGSDPTQICRAYNAQGRLLSEPLAPFSSSLAGLVASLGEPRSLNNLERDGATLTLQPFERGRQSVLAAPFPAESGVQVILELFEKTNADGTPDGNGFTSADRQLLAVASELGSLVLGQALVERASQRVLFDALEAALAASDSLHTTLQGSSAPPPEEPVTPQVLDQLRAGLRSSGVTPSESDDTIRLAEAIGVLQRTHGTPAVRHCLTIIENVRHLLDLVVKGEELAS